MINNSNCIGCQACVDICPADAINFSYDEWGEGIANVLSEKCINCGSCDNICPATNIHFNAKPTEALAVVSRKNKKTGSSGGVFFELASAFIKIGGIVYGAAFDDNLKLIHQKATTQDEIIPLCKSKYIHSDMSGVYTEIKALLKKGKKVMFVGTPCQTSAIKNLFDNNHSDNILLVDFLCHGTGTQKVFDACISAEEEKFSGKIVDFQFRSKSKKAEHSFSYILKYNKKLSVKKGYSFEFPYYNAYLDYSIFCDACYSCKYSCNSRVGDITLGDFWKIQKYNRKLKDYHGCSMIVLNNEKGKKYFDLIINSCELYSYPLEYAVKNNQSFYKPESYPSKKSALVRVLKKHGEQELVKELSCNNILKNKIYAKTPKSLIKLYHTLRGRK